MGGGQGGREGEGGLEGRRAEWEGGGGQGGREEEGRGEGEEIDQYLLLNQS